MERGRGVGAAETISVGDGGGVGRGLKGRQTTCTIQHNFFPSRLFPEACEYESKATFFVTRDSLKLVWDLHPSSTTCSSST